MASRKYGKKIATYAVVNIKHTDPHSLYRRFTMMRAN